MIRFFMVIGIVMALILGVTGYVATDVIGSNMMAYTHIPR